MGKTLLRLLGAAFGAALTGVASTAWEYIKGVLASFGADYFSSGTVEGVIAYAVLTVAIFAGGFLVSRIPIKRAEPTA